MSGKVFERIPAMRLSGFLTALMAIVFFYLSVPVYADEITYIGDGKGLWGAPAWFSTASSGYLFPGTADKPLSSNNKVTIDYMPAPGKTNVELVVGGLSELGNVTNNEIVLIHGQINLGVSGGFSDAGKVSDNTVTISNGHISAHAYGGMSRGGNAISNNLVMSSGFVGGYVYGGVSLNGSAEGNSVVISGGITNDLAGGGWSHDGDAIGNTMTIKGGSINGIVYGGEGYGDAVGNVFVLSGGSINGYVYGGTTGPGIASDNTVIIGDGSVSGGVFGGRSGSGDAVNNIVTISGGVIGDELAGGFCMHGGSASANTVTISGGSLDKSVYGGWSSEGNTKDNTVTISGGSIGEDIFGGRSFNGDATGNTVTISGKPELADADILGGYTEDFRGDGFTGNILNFKSSGISAAVVDNFEYYNFYLPESAAADKVMLSVKKAVSLSETTVKIFLQDGSKLRKGDKIALIHSGERVYDAPQNKSCKAQLDGLLYEFSIYVDRNNLWAEVTKISSAAKEGAL